MLAFLIITIPFIGTAAGSAAVFFLKSGMTEKSKKPLSGFAAGVMLAASIWSLIIPSIEMAKNRGGVAWLPAVTGFAAGTVFLLFTEKAVDALNARREKVARSTSVDSFMLFLAVTLHNIPEGMAVGVACAGMLDVKSGVSAAAAMALSLGIAVQNIPEGAIISMPLPGEGKNKPAAFMWGVLSGAVEPAAALLTLLFVAGVTAVLPYLLSFAAGAMFYVTVEDLIPESKSPARCGFAAVFATLGFLLMMILDVAFR